jgi:hypothetical protein
MLASDVLLSGMEYDVPRALNLHWLLASLLEAQLACPTALFHCLQVPERRLQPDHPDPFLLDAHCAMQSIS